MKNSLLTATLAASALTLGATLYAPSAQAASVTGTLSNFTGDTAGGKFTFTDDGVDTVKLLAEITPPTVGGDIRGIFFNVLGGTTGLNVVSNTLGADVNNLDFNTCNTGGGNNMNGGGGGCYLPGGFDVGFAVASPGTSGGTITSALFTITRSGLTASSFLDQTIGMRYQATGGPNGSSKLAGTAVPTPALLPGLIGMGVAALRKRKAEAEENTAA